MEQTKEIFDSPTDWVASHVRSYVESGGAKGHQFYGNDTLLLTTRGRRTGRLRRTALIYGRQNEEYVVVGSNAGSADHPFWYLNLLAEPRVQVQVGAEVFPATARPATVAERPALWTLMTSLFPTYKQYQKKTAREIPIVVIQHADDPVEPADGGS